MCGAVISGCSCFNTALLQQVSRSTACLACVTFICVCVLCRAESPTQCCAVCSVCEQQPDLCCAALRQHELLCDGRGTSVLQLFICNLCEAESETWEWNPPESVQSVFASHSFVFVCLQFDLMAINSTESLKHSCHILANVTRACDGNIIVPFWKQELFKVFFIDRFHRRLPELRVTCHSFVSKHRIVNHCQLYN